MTAPTRKSHPMGFSGLREAINPPTTPNTQTNSSSNPRNPKLPGATGSRHDRLRKTTEAAPSVTATPKLVQANPGWLGFSIRADVAPLGPGRPRGDPPPVPGCWHPNLEVASVAGEA